jgi:hypothetical protein
MTTADWALAISLGSLVIALAGFVWNVWSKFIFPKPKVQVSFSYMTALIGDHQVPVISLSGTNHGPIPVTLKMSMMWMKREGFRRRRFAVLQPWHNFPRRPATSVGPFGGHLPKRLDVGEQHSVHFMPEHEAIAGDDYDDIGFVDMFGRHHWASRRQIRETRRALREETDEGDAAAQR